MGIHLLKTEAIEVEVWIFDVVPCGEFFNQKNSMPKNKRHCHGVGAKVSIYMKFLHPRKAVSTRYPHYTKTEVLDNLLVVAQEEEKLVVSKRQQVCLTMQHDDFDNGHILHAVAQYCKVTEEGPIKSLFNIAPSNNVKNDENVAAADNEEQMA